MFLLKTVFWLAFLIAIIPAGKQASTAPQAGVSTIEVLSVARDVWNDVSAFCERNHETCETGNQLAAEVGAKARTGARMLYVYLDGHLQQNATDDFVNGSVNRPSR